MKSLQKCPTCGHDLPNGVPAERCPRCLLMLAFGPQPVGEMETQIREVAPREALGTMIGRYRLLEEIGEGGFGIVYLAEQMEPVRRKVALKVIKPGMDTLEVVARFEAERQALALMDHPNIARVYDGGETGSGRPYFVMEFVAGIPLTKYCDAHGLDLRERLTLLLIVASAVQHAHQKGIIHRDLKPSNILVFDEDRNPFVKVIDFGIAKAVSMELTEKTLPTAHGCMMGTPQYMAPEQAEWKAVDVDTRSDIYSLGVILYELLTGTTPLDPAVLREAGYGELQKMVREEEALRPSARIVALRQAKPEPGTGHVPPMLGDKPVARDLDWVVMKALEKDRSRRYQTVNGFALDLRRFLDNEPVSASPPSATYRFAKFARRNRFAVAWTGAFSIFLIGAAIGMTLLYFHAQEEAKTARLETRKARIEAASALRWSKEPECRFDAFASLAEARAIPSDGDEGEIESVLRDEVIACLSLVDTRVEQMWKGNPDRSETVSADSRLERYAIAGTDGSIAIHRYPELTLLRTLPGHGEAVGSVLEFSPKGNRLAAVYGESRLLRLWKLRDELSFVEAGPVIHHAFDFFPDGGYCVVGRAGKAIEIVEARSGATVREFALPGIPLSVRVNRDGTRVAVSMAGMESQAWSVEILDLGNGGVLGTLDCPDPGAVAWSPYDDSLAVCGGDGIVRVWTSGEWKSVPLELAGHTHLPDALVWSPDGRLLASQSQDGTIRLWDPFQGESRCWHAGRGSSLAFSPEGDRLGILVEGERLAVLEVASGDVCYRGRRHESERNRGDITKRGVHSGIWNPEGTMMASSGDDGVRLWNREGRHLGLLPVPGARGLGFSGQALYVGSGDGLFRFPMRREPREGGGIEIVIEAPTMLGAFSACEELAAFPDGSRLALAARSRDAEESGAAIWLVDPEGKGEAERLESPAGAAYCAISRDGRWLAAGTREGTGVRVWSLPDAVAVADLTTAGGAKVAFSQEDEQDEDEALRMPVQWLATGDSENYRFYRTGTWEADPTRLESRMGGNPGVMAFSPRRTALAVVYQRAELQFYHPTVFAQVSLPDFDRELPLCFDPEGRIMVTAGQSGEIFFWNLDVVRAELDRLDLDWKEMEPFKASAIEEIVRQVRLPSRGE